MSDEISIEGLDKAEVLMALFNGARPQGMGFLHYDPKPMEKAVAQDILVRGTYFDYVQGRVMKVDLSGDSFSPWGYDRDNGKGAAETIIDTLRSTGETNPVAVEALHVDGVRDAAGKAMAGIAVESKLRPRVGGMSVLELGLADVVEELKPKLDAVLGDE